MKAFWCISYILIYPLHVHSLFFGSITNGKIETIGYGLIGGTLDMTCNITNPNIQKNASDIKFSFNNTELNNTFILGEKSKKLVLELNGPEMNGAHIYCQVYNPTFTRIDSKIINVEYAPQNITNFFCVNHEWDVFLSCSWNHPVQYLNQSNIQVTSRWKSQYLLDYTDCSESNYNYCNLSQGSFFSNKRMTISVEVKNTRLNVSTTSTFEFDTNYIVKPPPLKTVVYEILNSTCILLNWTDPRPQRKKNVNVTYESEWKDPMEFVTYVVEDGSYAVQTVCGLLPYTKYTFNFTVYPESGGYASETISISTEKTRSSVPLHSPNTTGGAMYYKTQECQQGKLRNVTIYWQPIEERNWYGVPRGFSIQYSETGGLETTNKNVLLNTLSYTMQLDCNLAYDINITAENDAGPSFPPSFLRVPKYEPDFQPPRAKVEVPKDGNTNLVSVSWNVTSMLDQSKVEATVFWCKKSVGSICEGQVYWKKCSSSTSTHLNTIDSADQYTFGVSLETYTENTDDRRNTGLQWEECIYVRDKKPETSPKLSLISTSEDKTLSVRWTRLACQSGSPFIIKYTVYYCKTQEKKCKGTTHQTYMQPEEDFLKLNNLEAEQEYGFWVTASSEWGEGPRSDWIYGIPVDNNLTAGEIVGIVIGGLFVMVLAAAGAVFIIRHVKRKTLMIPQIDVPETSHIYSNLVMDDKDEKDFDNEKYDTIDSLPNGLIEKSDHMCKRQLSKDSGFAEEHKNRNSEEEEEEEVGKEKKKEPNTKSVALPQDYIRVEDNHLFNGSSQIPVLVITVGFMGLQSQSPQREKIWEPMGKVPDHVVQESTDESNRNPGISSYVKCHTELSLPNNQHQEKEASDNIQGVITHKQLEVPAVNDYVQNDGNIKSSPEPYGIRQPEAAVSHPQSTLADCIAQHHPDVNNYVSNVSSPEPEPTAGNNTGHSDVSNCITNKVTPKTGSEGQSIVSDYVTSVSQPQQMCADRSTKGQPAVSGYVSNVMNSFPLSGNSSLVFLTNGTYPQPMSTSMNAQCQSSDSGYVTGIPSPTLPPFNSESQLQPDVNDHVFNTQSMSVDSDSNNQLSLSNYVHDAMNAEPAEMNNGYQAAQDNYIHDTIIMHQVYMDVNPHDQTPVSNYVTSVTNPQPGSE